MEWFCIGEEIVEARFRKRINRFLAEIKVGSVLQLAHLHDSGRLKELLRPGARVIAARHEENSHRKTRYTLYFVERDGALFTVNSTLPNKVFELYLKARSKGYEVIREFGAGKSRVDFAVLRGDELIELIEVKGVNLKDGDYFLFPDAPTARGRKHVQELKEMLEKGIKCRLVFVAGSPIAEKIGLNERTDPLFAEEVRSAVKRGLEIEGYAVDINLPCIRIARKVPVVIDG